MAASSRPDTDLARQAWLGWYHHMGVDEIIGDTPVDRRLRPSAAPAAQAKSSPADNPPQAAREPLPVSKAFHRPQSPPISDLPAGDSSLNFSDSAAMIAAHDQARSAKTRDELKDLLIDFKGCALRETARNTVFADGNPQARIMMIGEAPGRDEDIQGLPFVGRSGKLLDRMLAAIEFDRSHVYITNFLPWRPPGNRRPSVEEIEICRPFLERHIALTAPDFIVALGGVAATSLTRSSLGIMKLRGKWTSCTLETGATYALMPTFHPAYLLRKPDHKKLSWRDFLMIRARFTNTD